MLLNCGVGEDYWESFDCKEIKPVNGKVNQSWIFIGRTDAEAEASILWSPDMKTQLTGKDSDAEKHWEQEEKRAREDKMVGWHHWLNGHGFEQTLGGSEGQESLVCCSPWGHKKSDTTERLNKQQYTVMHVRMLSRLSRVWVFATLWTVAHQAPLSM